MRGLLWRGRRCQQAVSWKSWDAHTIVRSHGPRAHSRLRPSSWYILGVLSADVGTPMLRNEETFQPVCLDVRMRVTELLIICWAATCRYALSVCFSLVGSGLGVRLVLSQCARIVHTCPRTTLEDGARVKLPGLRTCHTNLAPNIDVHNSGTCPSPI